MSITNTLASFAVFALVAGTVGYLLVRTLEVWLPLSARTRQLLYLAVLVLPLTTFLMDIAHWTDVCASYAAHLVDGWRNLLSARHGVGSWLTLTMVFGYIAYFCRGKTKIDQRLLVSSAVQQHERVARLLRELEAGHLPVRIYRTSYPIACVVGLRPGALCLSQGLLEIMDDNELQAVLAHELAHVHGNDNWLNLAVLALRSLTFFSPVAHLAAARYATAREEAADDRAAGIIAEPADLASALLKIVSRQNGYAGLMQPAFGFSSALGSEQSLHRVERILQDAGRQPHNRLLEQGALLAVTTVLPLLFC